MPKPKPRRASTPNPALRHLGRLFMVPVPAGRAEWSAVERAGVPHFIVFARDFETAGGLQELTRGLASRARRMGAAPLLAIDEEGGLVSQLRKLGLEAPGPRLLARAGGTPDESGDTGSSGGLSLARASAAATARTLRSLGLNLNFAPVADVDSEASNPVIGARAVSASPAETGEWCAAWIRAHQAAGVAATAKHFPGHGAARADSHLTLPVIDDPRARIKLRDLPPFLAVVRAGVAAVMTAHVRYPGFDPRRPATLSPRILALLRGPLGFEGLVVSDSLDMAGVRKYGDATAPVEALLAGCDLLLYGLQGRLWRKGYDGVSAAVRSGRVPAARVEEALERIEAVAKAYPVRPAARTAAPAAALRGKWDAAAASGVEVRGALPSGAGRIVVAGESPWAAQFAAALESLEMEAAIEPEAPARRPAPGQAKDRAGSRAGAADRGVPVRDAAGEFRLLVLRGRSGWRAEDRATLDRWRAEGRRFGVLSLLSPARLADPEARGSVLRACAFEDTGRALRAAARRIARRR